METSKLIIKEDVIQRFNESVLFLKFIGELKNDKDISSDVCNPTAFSKAKNGDPKYFTVGFVKRYSDHYGINSAWILDNNGEMMKDQPTKEEDKHQLIHAPEGKFPKRRNSDESIPIYDVDFLAGNTLPIFEDAMQEKPAYYMDIPQFSGCEGFRTYSDSMEPKIKSGTILFGQKMHSWIDHVEFGQIYGIVCNDDRRYLKYIKKSVDNPSENFLLVSENSFYDPFEIPKKNIRSIWLIHGWLHKNT